jgi:hypothetical protein
MHRFRLMAMYVILVVFVVAFAVAGAAVIRTSLQIH